MRIGEESCEDAPGGSLGKQLSGFAAAVDDPGMDRDPIPDARALVRKHFPQALWAVLAGSVLTAHRTAGSDLDLVVVPPLGDPLARAIDAALAAVDEADGAGSGRRRPSR